MEASSPATASNDLGHKRDMYAELGITEYWASTPRAGSIMASRLRVNGLSLASISRMRFKRTRKVQSEDTVSCSAWSSIGTAKISMRLTLKA